MNITSVNTPQQPPNFKAITKVRIPSSDLNPKKLIVTVKHDKDFPAIKWKQIIIETIEKGKVVAKEVFGNNKKEMPIEDVVRITDHIDKITNTPPTMDKVSRLMEEYFKQVKF